MNPGILVVLFLGLGGVVLYFAWQRQKAVHELIRQVAAQLGLEYRGMPTVGPSVLAVFAPWRMEGVYRGTRVECYTITRGGGNSRTTYTVVEAFLSSPLKLGLHVGKETALTRLGKLVLELQDITVGAQRFDEAVRVKARDVEGARALLGRPEAQDAVLRALELSPSTVVTDLSARMERRGSLTDTAVFREALERLTQVAQALETGAA